MFEKRFEVKTLERVNLAALLPTLAFGLLLLGLSLASDIAFP